MTLGYWPCSRLTGKIEFRKVAFLSRKSVIVHFLSQLVLGGCTYKFHLYDAWVIDLYLIIWLHVFRCSFHIFSECPINCITCESGECKLCIDGMVPTADKKECESMSGDFFSHLYQKSLLDIIKLGKNMKTFYFV